MYKAKIAALDGNPLTHHDQQQHRRQNGDPDQNPYDNHEHMQVQQARAHSARNGRGSRAPEPMNLDLLDPEQRISQLKANRELEKQRDLQLKHEEVWHCICLWYCCVCILYLISLYSILYCIDTARS